MRTKRLKDVRAEERPDLGLACPVKILPWVEVGAVVERVVEEERVAEVDKVEC